MADRILVWIENPGGIGKLFRSAVWNFDLDAEGQRAANEKYAAFQTAVTRRDTVGIAKMGWTEEWDRRHQATCEDLALEALVIQSHTSPPKEGLHTIASEGCL